MKRKKRKSKSKKKVSWKEFLRPHLFKIIFTIFLLIVSYYLTTMSFVCNPDFFEAIGLVVFTPNPGVQNCSIINILFPILVLPLFILELSTYTQLLVMPGLLLVVVWSYFLSCLIFHLYKKYKK